MSHAPPSAGIQFFGNLVDLDCHIQDLRLVLSKTEEIQFPEHEDAFEGETLIADIHPDITRKGFIVNLLIALDDQFKVFCQILKKATGQRLKWNDLKGSPLERFMAYSDKVCGLELAYDDHVVRRLRGFIEVGNCIVHNTSSMEGFSKHKAIEEFASAVDGVNIEDGYITLELAACHECADIVFEFMKHAYYAALEVFPK